MIELCCTNFWKINYDDCVFITKKKVKYYSGIISVKFWKFNKVNSYFSVYTVYISSCILN